VPLIHALTVRLLEGQFPEGGWGYTTPKVEAKEAERLRELLQRRAELKTTPDGQGPTPPPIDPDLQDRLRRLERKPGDAHARIENQPQDQKPEGGIDNSNTQFAVLALWVARRHGLPTDEALRWAERYFRSTHTQGSWGYNTTGVEPYGRAAMTCSGLLGIAVGAGVVREAHLRTVPEKGGQPPALRDPLN